ncbi:MAG: YqaA family protein [Alphaproteobacteria bacterium]|nr:YqaA family protein [Alphaproteobacteria bacterium]
MFRGLYDWTMKQAAGRHAQPALAAVSFAESSFFPIPPDVMLIPMVLARPERAWWIATVCTISSVLGGILGYAIGYFLFDTVGQAVLDFYGYRSAFEDFAANYNEWGAWIVFLAGVTPFPYKVITIASGVTALNPWVFMVASLIARSLRFFGVAALLWKYGPPIREFIDKRLNVLGYSFLALLVGGFVVVRFVL